MERKRKGWGLIEGERMTDGTQEENTLCRPRPKGTGGGWKAKSGACTYRRESQGLVSTALDGQLDGLMHSISTRRRNSYSYLQVSLRHARLRFKFGTRPTEVWHAAD